MAKITGIPPVPRGRYWLRGTGTVRPASDADARILTNAGVSTWPLMWELHQSGTRLAVPNTAMGDGISDGDYIDVPATLYGANQIIGPRVILEGTLWDNTGQPRYLRREGVIGEDSNGEWNLNALMTGDSYPTGSNTTGGAAAGALTMLNVGVDIPSMAAFSALDARVSPLPDNTVTNADGPSAFPLGVTTTTRTDGNGGFPTAAGSLLTRRPLNPDGLTQEWTAWQSTTRWIRRWLATGAGSPSWGPWERLYSSAQVGTEIAGVADGRTVAHGGAVQRQPGLAAVIITAAWTTIRAGTHIGLLMARDSSKGGVALMVRDGSRGVAMLVNQMDGVEFRHDAAGVQARVTTTDNRYIYTLALDVLDG